MNIFIQKHLQWTSDSAARFIGNRSDIEVVDALLAWETHPSERKISSGLFQKILPVLKLHRYHILLQPWMTAHRAQKFLADATLFELETTTQVNSFYPMYAFGVSFVACVALATEFKTKLSADAHMYALVARHLTEHPVMTIDEARAAFLNEGLPCLDATRLIPFPHEHLARHALREVDPDCTAPAFLASLVAHGGQLVSAIRERRFMSNRLVRVSEGYVWKNKSSDFVRELKRMRFKH